MASTQETAGQRPTVLVVGASRGIGAELVSQSLQAGAQVWATARDEASLQRLSNQGARALKLDVSDPTSAAGLAWPLDGVAFDAVYFCAGVFGPRHQQPEPPTQEDFDLVMHTNVLGPMLILPQLRDHLASRASVLVLSSVMGSLSGRGGHSGWLYRASKAAVNSVVCDLAAHAPKGTVVCAVHTGWVRTAMGGAQADLSVGDCARDLQRLADGLEPMHNGGFFNHDGKPLPW
jgi:NAD(P)-dependent dehydrogenase (short-subunit alcohol dehydrogenase family)